MPSYILAVDGKPIVLAAHFGLVTETELQGSYRHISEVMKSYERIWLILDLSLFEMNLPNMLAFVRALTAWLGCSPSHLAVTCLLVWPDSKRLILQTALFQKQIDYEILLFPSLDEAYQFALECSKS